MDLEVSGMFRSPVKPKDKGVAQSTSPPAINEGNSTPEICDFSFDFPQTGGVDAAAVAPIAIEKKGLATSLQKGSPHSDKLGTGPGTGLEKQPGY